MSRTAAFHNGRRLYDCIGVGFGPSNIALAISLEERGLLANSLFFESRDEVAWQPEMLMAGTDIQHNPLRDLVTPRNPLSPYGFLSYLKERDRLFDYLNLDAPFPPRSEYAGYVAWVAQKFQRFVRLSSTVAQIETVFQDTRKVVKVTLLNGEEYFASTLSFASGRTLNIPDVLSGIQSPRLININNYHSSINAASAELISPGVRIGVVGGSQSAAEILLDISKRFPESKVFNICQGFGFKQKDLSPFTEVIYYPEFVDYYHCADEGTQKSMSDELKRSNYGAADHDVISALNFSIYEQKVSGKDTITLLFNKKIQDVQEKKSRGFLISLRDRISGHADCLDLDYIIIATGFKNFGSGSESEPLHPLLKGISTELEYRKDGGVKVSRDYRVVPRPSVEAVFPSIFLNGLCESTHGFGDAGSFSLLSVRSDIIGSAISQALQVNEIEKASANVA